MSFDGLITPADIAKIIITFFVNITTNKEILHDSSPNSNKTSNMNFN